MSDSSRNRNDSAEESLRGSLLLKSLLRQEVRFARRARKATDLISAENSISMKSKYSVNKVTESYPIVA